MSPMTPSAMTPSSMTPAAAAAPSARRRPGRRRVLGQRLGRPRALEVPTLQVSHGRSSTERRTGSCCAGTSSKGLLGSCRGPTAPSATRRRRCGTRHGSLPTSDLQSLEPSSTSPRQAGRHRRRCDACRRQAMHANTRKSGTEWSAGDRSHFSTAGDRSHFGTAEDRSNEQRKTAYMDSGRPPTRTTDDRAYFFAQRHNTMLEPATPHPTRSHSHASPTSRLDLLILAVCNAVTQMMPSSVRW